MTIFDCSEELIYYIQNNLAYLHFYHASMNLRPYIRDISQQKMFDAIRAINLSRKMLGSPGMGLSDGTGLRCPAGYTHRREQPPLVH